MSAKEWLTLKLESLHFISKDLEHIYHYRLIVGVRLIIDGVMIIVFFLTFASFIRNKKKGMKDKLIAWKCKHNMVRYKYRLICHSYRSYSVSACSLSSMCLGPLWESLPCKDSGKKVALRVTQWWRMSAISLCLSPQTSSQVSASSEWSMPKTMTSSRPWGEGIRRIRTSPDSSPNQLSNSL